MALKTEDDYQDEIDDLIKEIDRLYDEGTDLGFKLKREEEMDQEERALETQEDYQRELDRVEDEATKIELQIMDKEDEINKLKADIKKLQAKQDPLLDKANKLEAEAKKKGFKLKRSEEADFEIRALETEKDYQREYDRIYSEAEAAGKKLEEEWVKKNKECTDLHKEMQTAIAKYQSAKKEANQIEGKLEASDQKYIKMIDKVVAEAKKKGFKIKESHISRGFIIDFETRKNSIIADLTGLEERKQEVLARLEQRALETEKDYARKKQNGERAIGAKMGENRRKMGCFEC